MDRHRGRLLWVVAGIVAATGGCSLQVVVPDLGAAPDGPVDATPREDIADTRPPSDHRVDLGDAGDGPLADLPLADLPVADQPVADQLIPDKLIPDQWVVGVTPETNTSCSQGQLVGGGVDCAPNLVTAALAGMSGWTATCDTTGPQSITILCATGISPKPEYGSSYSATTNASCNTGAVAVGGGCQCNDGASLLASRPITGPSGGWQCECSGPTSAVQHSAQVSCIPGAVAQAIGLTTSPQKTATMTAIATCTNGKMIGGGCWATNNPLYATTPDSTSGWRCAVSGASSVTAVALCVP